VSSIHQIERSLAKGDALTAERDCLALLADEPNHPDLITLLALCEESRQQPDQALARLERVCLSHPDHARAHFHKGRLLMAQGAFDQAEKALAKVVLLEPNHAPSRHLLGRIALRQRRLDDAVDHLKTTLKADDRYSPAHCDLALALLEQGDVQGALESAGQALTLEGGVAEAHLAMGAVKLSQGHWEHARDHLIQATDLDPDSAQGLLMLAKAYQLGQHHRQALTALDRLSGTDKQRPQARHARAISLAQLDQPDLARELWEALVSERPHVEAALHLVELYLRISDRQALAKLQNQVHQYEDEVPHLKRYLDAVCDALDGRLSHAMETFEDLVKISSESISIRAGLWRAELLLDSHESKQAVLALQQLLERHSPPPAVSLQMAEMAQRAGDSAFAVGCLDEALSLEGLPDTLRHKLSALRTELQR